jgi:hypothetical protein
MELTKMLAELKAEKAALDEAIVVLARMVAAQPGRRGRPPAWLSAARPSSGENGDQPKRQMSEETRKKMARAQKKRWAAYHKAQES